MTEFLKELLLPSSIAALLLLAGVFLSALGRQRRVAKIAIFSGTAVYLFFSSGLVASALIAPLEHRYPVLQSLESHSQIRTIVVLTAYSTNDKEMPLTSRAGTSALYRVVEAARLWGETPIEEVHISGSPVAASVMAQILVSIGVPDDAISVDDQSKHTVDSARRLRSILAGKEFFLVTSAGHMPRALGVFDALGLSAIPMPTDFQLPGDWKSASLMPTPFHLHVSNLAVHEYLGLTWYRLTGKTARFW